GWVVWPLLVLVVGVLVGPFWPLGRDALFERGAELMARPHRVDWERAWREYLGPLGERFPDHPYQKEVEQFRRKLEASRNPAPPLPDEAQRFYRRGERLLLEGDSAAARKLGQNVGAGCGED